MRLVFEKCLKDVGLDKFGDLFFRKGLIAVSFQEFVEVDLPPFTATGF